MAIQVWEEFLAILDHELGKQTVDFWLRPLQVTQSAPTTLRLHPSDSFQILWFEEHVRPIAEARLSDRSGQKWRIELESGQGKQRSPDKTKLRREPSARDSKLDIRGDAIDARASFERTFEYPGNQLAKRALMELASDPYRFASEGFNPFYLYGPTGSGTSYLLMACAGKLRERGHKVLYVTGQTFTEHVVQAIRLGMMQQFRRFYRGVDVLFLDGVELFSHKGATQEEFFHTFNSLHVEAKAIVVSSKVPPKDLKGIEPRLVSRFEWGLMAHIEMPNSMEMEQLLALITKEQRSTLTSIQNRWLIEQFGSSCSLLVKAHTTLHLRAHRQGVQLATLTPNDLSVLLQDLKNEQAAHALTAEKIVQVVSDYYGITNKDLLSKCQRREFSLPRQVAMYLCREKLQMPFLKIAQLFGRDHSTVMASCKLITKQLLEKNSRLQQELPLISQKL